MFASFFFFLSLCTLHSMITLWSAGEQIYRENTDNFWLRQRLQVYKGYIIILLIQYKLLMMNFGRDLRQRSTHVTYVLSSFFVVGILAQAGRRWEGPTMAIISNMHSTLCIILILYSIKYFTLNMHILHMHRKTLSFRPWVICNKT